jgi:hypothetical protein
VLLAHRNIIEDLMLFTSTTIFHRLLSAKRGLPLSRYLEVNDIADMMGPESIDDAPI